MNCSKCDADITDSYQESDPNTGIIGGFYCEACDIPVEDDREIGDYDE